MATEKVKIYDQDGKKKGISPLLWLLPLLLLLGLLAYFLTRDKGTQQTATTATTDNIKPDTTQMQPASAFTAQRITEELTSKGQIAFYENAIHFETAKATIMPDSAAVLGEVASVIKAHPDWKFRVEGHTDNVGAADANQTLSQARADAVVAYLSDHGVDKSKLDAKGFGPDKSVADNSSDTGRAQNRRVVLVKE